MASRRNARSRKAADPQTVLIYAEFAVRERPSSRNRKKLIAARERYAARVITAPEALSDLDEAS
ncbi:MAG TPA: hypothetical protein VHX38_02750 [Pseudonocardiaceae bacterium]|jgi:hypothetical protein|nr:hypothetical protein [Pseudonocardiaceae bacterium]